MRRRNVIKGPGRAEEPIPVHESPIRSATPDAGGGYSGDSTGQVAEAIGARILARFKAQAVARRAAGLLLRAEIQRTLQALGGKATASTVRTLLPRQPLPSLRCVQWHLKEIRAMTSVLRGE
jgi:hypothetical protein